MIRLGRCERVWNFNHMLICRCIDSFHFSPYPPAGQRHCGRSHFPCARIFADPRSHSQAIFDVAEDATGTFHTNELSDQPRVKRANKNYSIIFPPHRRRLSQLPTPKSWVKWKRREARKKTSLWAFYFQFSIMHGRAWEECRNSNQIDFCFLSSSAAFIVVRRRARVRARESNSTRLTRLQLYWKEKKKNFAALKNTKKHQKKSDSMNSTTVQCIPLSYYAMNKQPTSQTSDASNALCGQATKSNIENVNSLRHRQNMCSVVVFFVEEKKKRSDYSQKRWRFHWSELTRLKELFSIVSNCSQRRELFFVFTIVIGSFGRWF